METKAKISSSKFHYTNAMSLLYYAHRPQNANHINVPFQRNPLYTSYLKIDRQHQDSSVQCQIKEVLPVRMNSVHSDKGL